LHGNWEATLLAAENPQHLDPGVSLLSEGKSSQVAFSLI